MKKILGLDLGTNSIGWALIEKDANEGKILGMGSRIIPTDPDLMGRFTLGQPLSKANAGQAFTPSGKRTDYRGTRHLRERHLLRRERLHRILNILGFLPGHYANQIDFEKRLGKFLDETEPKLAYAEKDFLFKKSFNEMLEDFKKNQSQLFYTKSNGQETKIPYDWTIYYLRKKALTHRIEKEELAWIILNFNQKRGYYQLRGEDDTEATRTAQTRIYFDNQIITEITDTGNTFKGLKVIQIKLANGDTGKYFAKELPNWIGLHKNIIATIDLDKEGNDRFEEDGSIKRRFSIPTEEDWEKRWKLIKIKTEDELKKHKINCKETSGLGTVGTYIYTTLLQKPNQKIRGKLIRTIERKFYKEELTAILQKQIALQPDLFTDELYTDCVRELYRNNEAQQIMLSKRDFVHLFVEDIIFYQRPLKSQKSSIGNCPLEYRIYRDKNGKEIKEYLRATPKSNPLYQEFRIWQWLFNLKIYKKDDDSDVTRQLITNIDEIVNLFDYLMHQKEVNHYDVLKFLLTPIVKERYSNVKAILLNKEIEKEIAHYRWNYVFDDSKEREEEKSKKYPCNTTRYELIKRLEKVENVPDGFLDMINERISKDKKSGKQIIIKETREQQLWHIIYSVKDKAQFEAALKSFANKYNLDEISFVESFKKFPPLKSEYAAYSEKALKKLLPLMRLGKYWNENEITNAVKNKVESIKQRLSEINYNENEIDKVADDEIPKQILKSFIDTKEYEKGLRLYQAGYLVYGRHSEASKIDKWDQSHVITNYLDEFKQHSLRNPIVEQVVTETLRIVKDIWEYYGEKKGVHYTTILDKKRKKQIKSYSKFFDEIHIELGRDLKNTAEDRKNMAAKVNSNETTNLRIKALLEELKENSDGKLFVKDVRPYSPIQQDALKIFEEYALQNSEKYDESKNEFVFDPVTEDILKISKTAQPTKPELQRYKLWLEQRYRSPYTGQIIPLSRLFTEDYQIEHIIPKALYFDDSFNNKVICEAAVNQLKEKQLGMEFIQNHFGEEVELGFGKKVKIFTEKDYTNFVKEHYEKNNIKRRNLLLTEIPEKMIARQMNDTRYISKLVCSLLSNIVRVDKEDDGFNSKNLIPVNGKITTTLKQNWGLNDIWNDIILPRFERLNNLTSSNSFTYWNEQHQKFVPIDYLGSKKIDKKRIDHRHHAMDALVVACTTKEHVQYLNNENAQSQKYHLQLGLARKLRTFETVEATKMIKNEKGTWIKSVANVKKEVPKDFIKPWESFTIDAKRELEKVVVSFKQNLRVINKTINYYESYKDENGKLRIGKNGKPEKSFIKQKKTDNNWAIRNPMHEETVSGIVKLPWADTKEGKITTATRKAIDKTFDLDKIKKITDTGIQKILKNWIQQEKFKVVNQDKVTYNSELAFSPESIEELNSNIEKFNDGKKHKPITKVRIYEEGSGRFILGEKGNKKKKFVQGAPNLFFAVYVDELGNRSYDTIPLNIAVERLKQGEREVPLKKIITEKNKEKELTLLFSLSPNDLVYIPTKEEKEHISEINFKMLSSEQQKQLWFVNDFSTALYFRPCIFAKSIAPKEVDLFFNKEKNKLQGSFDYKTASLDGIQIKDVCIPLKIDRLGNITEVNNKKLI